RRCVEHLGDQNVISLFESLDTPEDEDADRVLADYDRTEKEEAKAAAVQRSNEGFFEAARTGNIEALKSELDGGAQIDLPDAKASLTALHLTAEEGHLDAARLLLDRGANINAKNFRSSTPLILAEAGETCAANPANRARMARKMRFIAGRYRALHRRRPVGRLILSALADLSLKCAARGGLGG
ncbi:MAG TPA: ankyrin repeat domain-containing protein, partial [Novosphingobium sp.]|nr:ankyrin repeat domain-containing protein [Novosphingobium sp.]